MKALKSIFIIALFSIVAISVKAQNSEANVTITKVVEISADQVWKVLRQMDDIQKYSSVIAKVEWIGDHGVGGQRKCLPPKGQEGYYVEQIVNFSDIERSYSYALKEGVPAKGMVNNFKVVDLGYNKSMIVWTSTYEAFLQNPQMNEKQFLGFINQSIEEMIINVANAAKKA